MEPQAPPKTQLFNESETYYIYKIFDVSAPENNYIGSTRNIFKRIKSHEYKYKNEPHTCKLYTYLQEKYGCDAWSNIDYEILHVGTGDNLDRYKSESEYIKAKKPKFNSKLPHRTTEDIKQQTRKNNMVAYAKKYICACGSPCDPLHRSQHLKTKKHGKWEADDQAQKINV